MLCKNHNHDNSCSNCVYCGKENDCSFKSILVDANVILSIPLQEQGMEKSQELLDNHRKKYKVAVNHLILGEIFKRLATEKTASENILDWLRSNFQVLNKFELLEVPFEHDDFSLIFKLLADCRCGNRDKIIATCAIIQNIELATFDRNLIEDLPTINKRLSKDKVLKDKKYVLKLASF